jgi:hypothetical protein
MRQDHVVTRQVHGVVHVGLERVEVSDRDGYGVTMLKLGLGRSSTAMIDGSAPASPVT